MEDLTTAATPPNSLFKPPTLRQVNFYRAILTLHVFRIVNSLRSKRFRKIFRTKIRGGGGGWGWARPQWQTDVFFDSERKVREDSRTTVVSPLQSSQELS